MPRNHHPQHLLLLTPRPAQGGFTNSFSDLNSKQISQSLLGFMTPCE